MYRKYRNQIALGENVLYQNLPNDLLTQLNRIIDWKPFEQISAKLHPSTVIYERRVVKIDDKGGGCKKRFVLKFGKMKRGENNFNKFCKTFNL